MIRKRKKTVILLLKVLLRRKMTFSVGTDLAAVQEYLVDFPFHMRGFPTLLPCLSVDRLRIRLCSTQAMDSISE